MSTLLTAGPVRPASPLDRDGALEAWRAALAGTGLRPPAATVADVQDTLTRGLLVVAGEPVAGMALGEPAQARGTTVPGLLQLTMVFVRPDAQRAGLGAALVEGLADLAWSQGYREMCAWVGDPAFLTACGLEPTGETDGDTVRLHAELEAPLREVVVASDGIRLGQLLKLAEVVDTGSEGKELLAAGEVEVNGEVEVRRGRQLVDGDEVRARDQALRVVLS